MVLSNCAHAALSAVCFYFLVNFSVRLYSSILHNGVRCQLFLRCIVCHNRNGGFCGQCAVAVGIAVGDFYRPDKGLAARGIFIEGTIFDFPIADFRRNILDFLVIHQQRYHARQGFLGKSVSSHLVPPFS